ncbi:MAG: hypothetical protein HND43_10455 [Armatimonadetes bacterium]|jgi:hypothetical protein|nr:hypothetical protein [Armatimonadota bacterium]NOG39796.1 hypothetical protein [Armatimonadota bacterium]
MQPQFDNYEIKPVVALDEDNGVIPVRLLQSVPVVSREPAGDEDTEIACWSIYGRLPGGGVECVADCPTAEFAQLVAEALKFKDQKSIRVVQ